MTSRHARPHEQHTAEMHKGRVEAFSDGVIAILITIMVLELKVPHTASWRALVPMGPVFFSYLLSFIYIGIYWNNHHHMMQIAKFVKGGVLWANLHLLFWLSLIPFATAWMGENEFARTPVAVYGIVLFLCGAAYTILANRLKADHGEDSLIARAFGSDTKGKISVVIYLIAVPLAYVFTAASLGLYVLVAAMWIVPDRRIEKVLAGSG